MSSQYVVSVFDIDSCIINTLNEPNFLNLSKKIKTINKTTQAKMMKISTKLGKAKKSVKFFKTNFSKL